MLVGLFVKLNSTH